MMLFYERRKRLICVYSIRIYDYLYIDYSVPTRLHKTSNLPNFILLLSCILSHQFINKIYQPMT